MVGFKYCVSLFETLPLVKQIWNQSRVQQNVKIFKKIHKNCKKIKTNKWIIFRF